MTDTTLTREQKRHALSLARMDDWDDPWGTTMRHWFGVAEVLNHSGSAIPPEWAYYHGGGDLCDPIARWHSPAVPCEGAHPDEPYCSWPEAEYVPFLDAGELGIAMLTYAGRVLDRYASRLKRAGRDY